MSDFYVGYLPKAQPALARFVRRVVFGLGLLAMLIASILAGSQSRLTASYFEFGRARTFEGIVSAAPYPALLVTRPGRPQADSQFSRYLLVAPGKHGAAQLMAGREGKKVRLGGQLIYRLQESQDGATMIEIVPGSIQELEIGAAPSVESVALGPLTLSGEIADSKCYLGVMNPGRGKVHRDCAARCISGGAPPIFISVANGTQYLLLDQTGHALGRDVLREFIAESITISGEAQRQGDTLFLAIDPQTLRHANR